MRIAILTLHHRERPQRSVTPELSRLLREWGVDVTLVYPDDQPTVLERVVVDQDLYVLMSGSAVASSQAAVLHALGGRFLNPHPATVRCRDKVVATRILHEAGVPVPETYVSLHAAQLASLLEAGPLVVRAPYGSQGRGSHVVWDAEELTGVPADGPVLGQRYHPHDGRDRKLYCIGGQVYGVSRTWPAHSYLERLGEPFTVPAPLREIALRCGEALGLDLYGVDVVVSAGRPYVVDVNPFPGFKGVPDAALRLADHVYAVAGECVGPASRAGVRP